ncbi:MAG: hypothetical protein JRG67_16285 [Deltaproteobacteria bacterium]|nr:hypothetical protein [Deltaproteobacteria bacterium]
MPARTDELDAIVYLLTGDHDAEALPEGLGVVVSEVVARVCIRARAIEANERVVLG